MADIHMVDVLRGKRVESRHAGSLAVCDASGKLVARAGDPGTVAFWRSAMKPVQAIAFAESGALEAFGLGEEALALACASHEGEPAHVAVVDRMLAAGGLKPAQLRCGVQAPKGVASPDERHSNCSGKHAGMLLASKHLGYPLDSYLDPAHPLQVRIRSLVANLSGASESDLAPAIDGCSAPIYALGLSQMATAFSRMLRPPQGLEKACHRILSAMVSHPALIQGMGGFDSDLMALAGDRVLSKRGAEGVGCLALRKEGLGVAIKIADGSGRAVPPVACEALRQLGVLGAGELKALARHARPEVLSVRGEAVGGIRPAGWTLAR